MQKVTIKGVMAAVVILLVAACSGSSQEIKSSDKPSAKAPGISIHEAAFMGNAKAVQEYVAAGTDLNQKDQWGSTPLTITATFNRVEAGKALIEGGADLNMRNNEGSTPLHVAAFFGRTELVKALLQAGADKTVKNNFGSTALEVVNTPFETLKPIYDQLGKDLGPLGLKLDYDQLKKAHQVIAEMLKK